MKATEFLERLPTTEPGPLYVLTGEDTYLQRACVREMLHRLIPEGVSRDFNYSEHDVERDTLRRVLDVARELPLPPARRLVVAHNFEKLTEAEVELLKDYVRQPVSTTTLVFCAGTLDKRRTSVTVLLKVATVIECAPLTPEEARKWILAYGRRQGFEWSPEALGPLIGAVGCDLARLTQESEKLMNYVGPGGRIGPEAVAALVVRSPHEDNFLLAEALWQGDAPRALRLLHRLLGRGEEPVALVGLLAWQLRQMLLAHNLMAVNTPRDTLLRELRLPPHRLSAFLGAVRKQSPARLRQGLIRLQFVDDALKRGYATPRLLLELFLCELLAAETAVSPR
ncbi:DNA polymerase III subunit delta [Chloracidobacterium thermophilum]|jgi:DNA polymerase-3 subunit delta|uniref:DNA polymerase III subunit delta n=1 Tax=Chloracidobacterium thermophilum (strain B) TaxID=981222 RepID=G2LEQ7_CHLTF|nr:DNA polymerase III subunit delta [Chloracidobacterium thermophilum]AEP12040.1 DNA polymerase III, delta subunit [Chloracidobacterium thermophilum B]QUV77789.1 DNA polymerase III subunit delta [Chloracidobacterium thermophilum]